jgi:hypothetical protein
MTSVDDVIENFDRFTVDPDWVRMHKDIIDFREKFHLSITEFLKCCQLDPNRSYFRQLTCRTGYKLNPSQRPRSIGSEFRLAVRQYLDSNVLDVGVSVCETLEILIYDWCLDNRSLLSEKSISDIRTSQSAPNGIIVVAFKNCVVSDEEILIILRSDEHIKQFETTTGSDLFVESRFESQLLTLTSPLCVRGHGQSGTASLLTMENYVFGFTCGHCVGKVSGVVTYCTKDPISSKYRFDSPPHALGRALCHETLDVAWIQLDPHLPLLINFFPDINLAVRLEHWWTNEALFHRREKLIGTKVTKVGASSGVTSGEIVELGGNFFYVQGHELTPFSVPGDSGSIVLDISGRVMGVVVSILLDSHESTYVSEVLPTWEFFDWLSDI